MGNKQCIEISNFFNGGNKQDLETEESNWVGNFALKTKAMFKGNLPRPLNYGDRLTIEGTVAPDAKEFILSLVCARDDQGNPEVVAYHHRISYIDNRAYYNVKLDGQWLSESVEEFENSQPIIARGDDFKIDIDISRDTFSTYIDDVPYQDYNFIVPWDHIRWVEIWDGLAKIKFMGVTFADPE